MATKKPTAKKPVAAKVAVKRVKKPAAASSAKKAIPSTKAGAKAKAAASSSPIKHHAKRLYHLTPKFVHGMVAGAFIGIVAVISLHATMPASALTLSSKLPRDKDSNAVMYGGALSTTELKQKYNYKGVSTIYNHFGISAAEVRAMGSTAVAGLVWKNGNVSVGGKVVATDAITAGREYISGSTKVVSGGTTFYKRAPRVSFNPNSLTAFVVMKDGVFQFAIISACGNPVVAKPIPKEKPKPVVPAAPVEPTKPTPSTQTPPSKPTPPPVEVETAAVVTETPPLPNTGPGAVIIIAILSVVGGYVFHMTHRHVRNKRRATHA